MLPASDPNILLSIVNMKLRDGYATLADYCDDADISIAELMKVLENAGWVYDTALNRFKRK